jgi:small conductance mechanosensitive channel
VSVFSLLAAGFRLAQGDEAAAAADSCNGRGAVCDWVYEATGNETLARSVDWVVGVPLAILLIAVGALILNRIGRRLVQRTTQSIVGAAGKDVSGRLTSTRSRERAAERAKALESILKSTVSFVVFAIAFAMILAKLGFDIVALVAGAGILGLALSFGAQSLVKDLLAGIAILVEDQYGIGDEVDVGYGPGAVERVTLRSTVVRDHDGKLWYVPNGQIERVVNFSQLWSRIVLDLRVPYEADLDRARAVIGEVAAELHGDARFASHFREAPDDPVVHELAPDAVVIRQILWVRRPSVTEVERELRTRAKTAVQREGIGIALPRQVVQLARR